MKIEQSPLNLAQRVLFGWRSLGANYGRLLGFYASIGSRTREGPCLLPRFFKAYTPTSTLYQRKKCTSQPGPSLQAFWVKTILVSFLLSDCFCLLFITAPLCFTNAFTANQWVWLHVSHVDGSYYLAPLTFKIIPPPIGKESRFLLYWKVLRFSSSFSLSLVAQPCVCVRHFNFYTNEWCVLHHF